VSTRRLGGEKRSHSQRLGSGARLGNARVPEPESGCRSRTRGCEGCGKGILLEVEKHERLVLFSDTEYCAVEFASGLASCDKAA